jgi:hypothetical protein
MFFPDRINIFKINYLIALRGNPDNIRYRGDIFRVQTLGVSLIVIFSNNLPMRDQA